MSPGGPITGLFFIRDMAISYYEKKGDFIMKTLEIILGMTIIAIPLVTLLTVYAVMIFKHDRELSELDKKVEESKIKTTRKKGRG